MVPIGIFNKRWRQVDLFSITSGILQDNTDKIIDLNKKQLQEGKNRLGEYLSPKYSEDPWFKRPGAAFRYAMFKQRLHPNAKRPFDVPDLSVVNVYYRNIIVRVTKYKVIYRDSASFANAIDLKYKNSVLGLNIESKGDAWKGFVRAPFVHEIKQILHL